MTSSRNLFQPGFEVALRRSEPAAAHAGLSTIDSILSFLPVLHVLIAPDKFKGSLSAAALAEGWRKGWAVDKPLEIELLPEADSGEGTAEAIHDALAGRWITLAVRDPIEAATYGGIVRSTTGIEQIGHCRSAGRRRWRL